MPAMRELDDEVSGSVHSLWAFLRANGAVTKIISCPTRRRGQTGQPSSEMSSGFPSRSRIQLSATTAGVFAMAVV